MTEQTTDIGYTIIMRVALFSDNPANMFARREEPPKDMTDWFEAETIVMVPSATSVRSIKGIFSRSTYYFYEQPNVIMLPWVSTENVRYFIEHWPAWLLDVIPVLHTDDQIKFLEWDNLMHVINDLTDR